MPQFIVGGGVSPKKSLWLRKDPDNQSYVSEFANDMVRKQEEKNFRYKSDFVREMVGSLAHKSTQGQERQQRSSIDMNSYVNKQHHGDGLAYNYTGRNDTNLRNIVTRSHSLTSLATISKVETVLLLSSKQQNYDTKVGAFENELVKSRDGDGNHSSLKIQLISLHQQLNEMLSSQQQLETAQQQLVKLLGQLSDKLRLQHRYGGGTAGMESERRRRRENPNSQSSNLSSDESSYCSTDSGHFTETDSGIDKERLELAQKGKELAKRVSHLLVAQRLNTVKNINHQRSELEDPNPRKSRLKMHPKSQQKQQSIQDNVVIEIRSKNTTEALTSRPRRSVSFSQGLLVSRISTDRQGTVTVPVPFLSSVGSGGRRLFSSS